MKLGENPAYVLGLTIDLPTEPSRGPFHNLPVPDFDETGFFGRRQQVNRVKRIINGAYPVVSILGDGGIGKTSVALKVAYELLDDQNGKFDAIVWVSAKATVLTAHEIKRINGAIEDSLGLFVRAAEELGSNEADEDPVEEVRAYLENFRILLILDNLETVLDTRLREFLLDLPVGSKVLLTSRIGAGIENPVALEPLSQDDSYSLLRALARIREVGAIHSLSAEAIQDLASKMSGHPAYIKWFVSGVQAGRRPEELLSDNTLLLEFCMSNVYKYLDVEAKEVLQLMQILPGHKSQAEVAFIADFSAHTAQSALLQLLTTNFVHMESQTSLRSLETTYQLSEFGRAYLDKQHPVLVAGRRSIMARNQEMHDLGWRLQAENSASPYDPFTVHIRDSGDFSTARLLRDAMNALDGGDVDSALSFCSEAQVLSPMYYESWRVEALVHATLSDHSAARSAYERACELNPGSSTLSFFFGCFLLDEQLDLDGALRYLRAAAQLDERNPEVYQKLAWALLTAGHHDDAVAASGHIFALNPTYSDAAIALIVGLRAISCRVHALLRTGYVHQALEAIETTFDLLDQSWPALMEGEVCDRLLQLSLMALDLKATLEVDDDLFRAGIAARFSDDLMTRLSSVDPTLADRRIARIKNLIDDKGFGFIKLDRDGDYFFHLRDLCNQTDWSYLEPGTKVAFLPNASHPRGRRAENVRWIG
ncbi:MAG: NB-ARC domain-containing protein [Candidatus Binatia bacterium]